MDTITALVATDTTTAAASFWSMTLVDGIASITMSHVAGFLFGVLLFQAIKVIYLEARRFR